MSFIVKGIDLPKDGEGNGCRFLIVDCFGTVIDDVTGQIVAEAIQIPKDHGNLKDENEIIKRLEEKEKEPLYQHDTDDWWVGIIDAETVVYTSPTILEAEE